MALINFTSVQDGTTAVASQVNTPLTTIYNEFNGNITAANLAAGSVTTAKLADASVTPDKLNNDYVFRANGNGSTTIGTSQTRITTLSEVIDTNNNFASGTYTAPVTGIYFIYGQTTVLAGGANETLMVTIYVNGSAVSSGARVPSDGANQHGSTVTTILSLSAGNTVDLYAISSVGGRGSQSGSLTSFMGYCISA